MGWDVQAFGGAEDKSRVLSLRRLRLESQMISWPYGDVVDWDRVPRMWEKTKFQAGHFHSNSET